MSVFHSKEEESLNVFILPSHTVQASLVTTSHGPQAENRWVTCVKAAQSLMGGGGEEIINYEGQMGDNHGENRGSSASSFL